MDPADNFRNLFLMAASDGQMAEAELRLLSHRGLNGELRTTNSKTRFRMPYTAVALSFFHPTRRSERSC